MFNNRRATLDPVVYSKNMETTSSLFEGKIGQATARDVDIMKRENMIKVQNL